MQGLAHGLFLDTLLGCFLLHKTNFCFRIAAFSAWLFNAVKQAGLTGVGRDKALALGAEDHPL